MDSASISVTAGTTVAAAPSEVFGLLGDLDRHRELTDHGLRILRLHGPPGRRSGGVVQLRGPAGMRRLARTSVGGAERHGRLWGTAETTHGARATLEWRVERRGDRTRVELRLDVCARTWRDRMLLRLGGRAWLGARVRVALERLTQGLAGSAPTTAALA